MRFVLLGEIQATTNGNHPLALGAPQQRSALGALLLEPRRAVPAARLIEAVWDRPPITAVKSLHGYVHRLRAILDAEPDIQLRTTGTGYLLDVDPERIDLHQFRRLISEAKGAADRPKVALLAAALGMWRGPALAQAGSRLLRNAAACLDEERLSAMEARLAARLRLGQHAECVAELSALVSDHPLRESSRAALMLAMYRCGRRADALAVYRAGRTLLSEEIGIEPGAELTALHERMLRDDPRLLDCALQPDHLVANARLAPGRAEPRGSAGTGRAVPRIPAELPHDIAGFVGRSGMLAELDACLAASEESVHRGSVIVAVDGLGGAGKTALVAHWAHRVRPRFPGGQLFIDLRGHDPHLPPLPSAEALAQLLRACGVPGAQIPDSPDERGRAYRSLLVDSRLLVILDNAASADQVRPLLPGSTTGLTVVTSRSFLAGLVATEDAHRIVVDPLPASDAVALLGVVAGGHRLAAEPGAAVDVAARCGHLPLALRIAGARLMAQPSGSIAALAASLAANPLAELALDQDAALRNTCDLSFRALTASAQRLLVLLGVFPGPDLTRPAVMALAADPAEVANRSLDECRRANLVAEHVGGRLRMHDIIRNFAADLAVRTEPAAVRAALRRVLDWYLSNVRQAVAVAGLTAVLIPPPEAGPETGGDGGVGQTERSGFSDKQAALGWLEDERRNLVALVRAMSDAEDVDTCVAAIRLALELRGFFRLRRYSADWLEAASVGLQLSQRAGSGADQACSWHSLGHAQWSVGAYQAAISCYEAALAASRASGWEEGVAASLSALGSVYHEVGRPAEAIACYQETLAVGETVRPLLRMITVGSIGLVYQTMGQLHQAIQSFAEADQLARQLGATDAEATTLGNLGETHFMLGDYELARTELDRALARYREAGSRNGEANVLTTLARLNADTSRYDDAVYQSVLALRIAQDVGDRRIECDALTASGVVLARRGELRAACRRLTEAAQVAESIGYHRGAGPTLAEAADVVLRLGEPRDAAAICERALSLAREGGNRVAEVAALTVLAEASLALSQYDAARQHVEAALRGCADMGLAAAQARAQRVRESVLTVTTGP